jgi:hypothetical protein
MQTLEATLILREAAPIDAKGIRILVLRAYADSILNDSQLDDVAIMGLLRTYNALIARKYEAGLPPGLKGEDAESLFRERAIEAFRTIFPEEPDGSEAFPQWPDELTLDFEYRKDFVRALGDVAGLATAQYAKALLSARIRSTG